MFTYEGCATEPESAAVPVMKLHARRRLTEVASAVATKSHEEGYPICGGFTTHESIQEAREWANQPRRLASFTPPPVGEKRKMATDFPKHISESSLASTVKKLTSFKNRFSTSKTGREASDWILEHWKGLLKPFSGASCAHVKTDVPWSDVTPMPGIECVLKGTREDEEVILGAHFDTTLG